MCVSASMCFPRVPQSSCVIMHSCISGPHVLILEDLALAFGGSADTRVGFGSEPKHPLQV